MILLYFLLGGIYTVAMIAVGIYIGYAFKPTVTTIAGAVKAIVRSPSQNDAGPVKPITRAEREEESKKGFTDRLKDLTTD